MAGSRSHSKTCLRQVTWSSSAKSPASAAPSEPPTPRNTAELHRRVRQATLRLKSKEVDLDRADLADLIQQLEKFGIAADKDQELEWRTLQQWQEAQKLEAKVDRRELGRSHGWVIDGKTLKELYIEQEAMEAKKKKRLQKSSKQLGKPPKPSPHPIRKQSRKRKAVSFVTTLFIHWIGKRVSVGKSLMNGTVIWKLFLLPRLVLFYLLLHSLHLLQGSQLGQNGLRHPPPLPQGPP